MDEDIDSGTCCLRRDHVSAALVNAAVRIRQSMGEQRARALLAREGIPSAVVDRVLSQEGQRRGR